MSGFVIIISGGMDSTVLLHQYKDVIKIGISFYYGQKHIKELGFAASNCAKLHILWKFIDLDKSNLSGLLNSCLLKCNEEKIPEGHYQEESMKKTVVPFRNGIMLSIACAIAASNNCHAVLIGNHAGDHAIYPDCKPEFINSMSEAMCLGTYEKIQIYAPFTYITKREIALIGKELNVDFSNTWTCYKGEDKHCGKCGACTERKEALAGFDPTIYEE